MAIYIILFINNLVSSCEAWIAFGSTGVSKTLTPDEAKELADNCVFKLKKAGTRSEIPDELMEKVIKVLGPGETNPI